MTPTLVIGVDPGATTGIVALPYADGVLGVPMIVQCDAECAVFIVTAIVDAHLEDHDLILGIEQYVVSGRSGRLASAGASRRTRDLIGELLTLGPMLGPGAVHLNTANRVKTWATDRKLDSAGLLDRTVGMGHARDGARHALFTAVEDGITLDPMSARVAR